MPVIPAGVVSSVIVAVTAADQFPLASANCTQTVFASSPPGSVHAFVAAYASGSVKLVPVFENCICATVPESSVAASVKVTVGVAVAGALPLITTVPVGAW